MIQFRSDLYKLLPANAHVCEVGVAEGFFSADILRWENVERLYMVDNWSTIPGQLGDGGFPQEWHDKNFDAAMERTVKYGFAAVVMKGLSSEMAKLVDSGSLDMVYLDADHSYDGVMSDLVNWFPKVKHGGIIAGHDYLAPQYGVYKAVERFTTGKYEVHIIHEYKPEDAGFWFKKQ